MSALILFDAIHQIALRAIEAQVRIRVVVVHLRDCLFFRLFFGDRKFERALAEYFCR